MSVTSQDALPKFPGQLLTIDAPVAALPDVLPKIVELAPVGPDPTEDLADEATSELGFAATRERPAPAPAPVPAAAGDEAAGPPSGQNLLRDRYVLETQLGNGGMATVWRAVDLRRDATAGYGRRVAVKLLRPELRRRPHCIARLQREFRQTQALTHSNVVRVFDLDCDRGTWFIVMELLTGETLGPVLRRAAPAGLAPREALRFASVVGDALAHAHARGITHGDVKPDNIFVTASGELRLLDFGVTPELAQHPDAGDPAGVVRAATRVYASPQVLAGEDAEPRDDVFSLACVAYEMLSGAHPYGRHGVDEALRKGVMPGPIAGFDDVRWNVLVAALDPARAGRPTMADFVRALQTEHPAEAKSPVAVAATPAESPPVVQPAPVAAPAAGAPRRLTLGVLATVAAGLVLVLGILIGRLDTNVKKPVSQAPPARLEAAPQPPPAVVPAADSSPAVAEIAQSPVEQAVPDGPPGLVFFDAPGMVVSKRAVVAAIPMRHLSRVRRAINVNWRLIGGTARAGRDYGGPESGVESFVEGNSFRILYVPILANPGGTLDRTFAIELTRTSPGSSLGPTTRIEVTIRGDS